MFYFPPQRIALVRSPQLLNGRTLTPSERPYLEQLMRRGARQFDLGGVAVGPMPGANGEA
jgi:hypothetical protein